MIFTQRLFTLLLGLLFATVLTDQASALYDPGVGRFCSRDPVRYISGPSLYQNYFRQKLVDPSGLFAMTDDELSNPNPKLPPIELPPLIDVPWPLLPLVPVDPIAPIIPPELFQPNPTLDCLEFRRKMYSDQNLPDFVKEELKCHPHIMCKKKCQKGNGPGNSAFPHNQRCHVCLNTSQSGTYTEWMALLIHELTHCSQFRGQNHCQCLGTKHDGADPPLPPLAEIQYLDCRKMETEAYTNQCQYLFPNHPELQAACVRAGVCASCEHAVGAPQGPCPPFPEFWAF